MRSFWFAGGGVGAGTGVGAGAGRRGCGGSSFRISAAGGRKTTSLRSSVLGSISSARRAVERKVDQHHQDRQVESQRDEKALALVEPLHTTPRVTPAP